MLALSAGHKVKIQICGFICTVIVVHKHKFNKFVGHIFAFLILLEAVVSCHIQELIQIFLLSLQFSIISMPPELSPYVLGHVFAITLYHLSPPPFHKIVFGAFADSPFDSIADGPSLPRFDPGDGLDFL
jgi:hypothetical protein